MWTEYFGVVRIASFLWTLVGTLVTSMLHERSCWLRHFFLFFFFFFNHWCSDINLLSRRSIFLPHWILFVSVANLQYQILKTLAILASINASTMCVYKPQTFPIQYLIHRIWPKRPRRPWLSMRPPWDIGRYRESLISGELPEG